MNIKFLPFIFHIVIEIPAALTYILKPSSHVNPLPESARLILQSFGGLLLTSNLVALVFLRRPFDDTSRQVAIAFAFWHVWPCHRAVVRLNRGGDGEAASTKGTLGGPALHLAIHSTLLVSFAYAGFFGAMVQ